MSRHRNALRAGRAGIPRKRQELKPSLRPMDDPTYANPSTPAQGADCRRHEKLTNH